VGDDYNREAFATAQRSTVTPNFHEARTILSGIALERISDPGVAKYIEFCNDLAGYCIDHGIKRSADLNPWSVLFTADKGKLARTTAGDTRSWAGALLTGQWWIALARPIASVVEGGWLALRLRGWVQLQEQLSARYR